MTIKKYLTREEVLNYNKEHREIVKNFSGKEQIKQLKLLTDKYEKLSII